ncbi:MAG: OmpH family outer membrane protein [Cognatishimia sp.]
MRLTLLSLSAVASLWFAPVQVVAQQVSSTVPSPIIIIESDRLYEQSLFSQRVRQEQDARKAVLLAENRQIAAELAEEEKRLTEQRSTMEATDFRKLADAFDSRVEEIRSIQDDKELQIIRFAEEERIRFFQELVPVLERILNERGASIVLEKRTTFASSSALNVTDRTLAIANGLLGDGAVSEEPEATEPAVDN